MLPPQRADESGVRLARFGHGVIAGVEVFALFEFVLEQVFFVGEFAVEAEEFLFFFGEFLPRNTSESVGGEDGWGGLGRVSALLGLGLR